MGASGPGPSAAEAAAPARAAPAPEWRFTDDAFADLWFHGLAVVGVYGFGPLPLYDASYALDARRARAGRESPAARHRSRRID